MSSQSMKFPNSFDEFVQSYGFKDKEQIYTNGIELIPVFRVRQWLEQTINNITLKITINEDTTGRICAFEAAQIINESIFGGMEGKQ